ncbi:saccharopine dehydrogenase family protein [Allokutzneria oryzae]|uniref:Saccharopine dehydrogenase family protein n=1 Tax=Allokutzneria oryzae TaxID=1378989 RepID=A0ABV6A7F0_9PSEU
MTWMVYGANGYTGRLVARLAVELGERPTLAGRSRERVAPLAAELDLPYRIFDLVDGEATRAALSQVDIVAHCAGPFSATAVPMVRACVDSRTHYLDVTGEIAVFEEVFARHADAADAGIVLLPGSGFDVVPTDCLAATLAAELPDARRLELALSITGGASPGTLKSVIESAGRGTFVRAAGGLRAIGSGHHVEVPFPSGVASAMPIPWGDLVTAHRSTGIEEIATYLRVPRMPAVAQDLGTAVMKLPVVRRIATGLVDRFVPGPSEKTLARSRSELWGRVTAASGETVSATLTGPGPYPMTADAVVRAVRRLGSGVVRPGAHTPSSAFGADFVRELDGVEVSVAPSFL